MRKWFYSLLKDQQPITYQIFIQYSIVEVNMLNAGFYEDTTNCKRWNITDTNLSRGIRSDS